MLELHASCGQCVPMVQQCGQCRTPLLAAVVRAALAPADDAARSADESEPCAPATTSASPPGPSSPRPPTALRRTSSDWSALVRLWRELLLGGDIWCPELLCGELSVTTISRPRWLSARGMWFQEECHDQGGQPSGPGTALVHSTIRHWRNPNLVPISNWKAPQLK